ncbi:MAG: hypothetical protein Q8L64_02125 [bacterium]|jgi:uncharacterized protein|nr:hypothetical protein [bacterium]
MSSDVMLVAHRCQTCGKVHYPRHDRCLRCKRREFDEIHPQGNAKLLTYTAIYSLPCGFDQPFLILGVGEFENNVRALGQIKTDSVKRLWTGMVVKAEWGPIRFQADRIVSGLVFEPLE